MTSTTPLPASNGPKKNPDARRGRRRWLPWLGAAGLGALIGAGLWPAALPVEVATVGRGDLLVTVNEEGMTRVKNRYVISSPVAGQLERIAWKAGAEVVAGKTVLAVLGTGGADLLDARGQAQAEARGARGRGQPGTRRGPSGAGARRPHARGPRSRKVP